MVINPQVHASGALLDDYNTASLNHASAQNSSDIIVNVNGIQYQNFDALARAISKEIRMSASRKAAAYEGL